MSWLGRIQKGSTGYSYFELRIDSSTRRAYSCHGSCFSLQMVLVPRAATRGRAATLASLTDVRKATDIVSIRFVPFEGDLAAK